MTNTPRRVTRPRSALSGPTSCASSLPEPRCWCARRGSPLGATTCFSRPSWPPEKMPMTPYEVEPCAEAGCACRCGAGSTHAVSGSLVPSFHLRPGKPGIAVRGTMTRSPTAGALRLTLTSRSSSTASMLPFGSRTSSPRRVFALRSRRRHSPTSEISRHVPVTSEPRSLLRSSPTLMAATPPVGPPPVVAGLGLVKADFASRCPAL